MNTRSSLRRSLAFAAPVCLFALLSAGCATAPVADPGDSEDVAASTAALESVPLWSSEYSFDDGWRASRHLRELADIDGDGRRDVIGFGDDGTFVSLSTGNAFGPSSRWLDWYGYGSNYGGWRAHQHPRYMMDADCDGRSDILGFGEDGVYLSRSLGTSFTNPTRVLDRFGYGSSAGGWRDEINPRRLADVDGDCRPDIIGFGRTGTFVSRGTGTGFLSPTSWIDYYGSDLGAGRFRSSRHPRHLVDVNGDGRADVVAFDDDGVLVSLSDGGRFLSPTRWLDRFGYGQQAGSWRSERHPRFLRDINGDGMSDVCGFGDDGVYVSYSTGHSFNSPTRVLSSFGYGNGAGGWRMNRHVRSIDDVDGDGRLDILGFGDDGLFVSRGHGTYFDSPTRRVSNFGYRSSAGSWRNSRDLRLLADVIGHGRSDIIGFGRSGVHVLGY